MTSATPMERFHERVTVDRDGCWIWNGTAICPSFRVDGSRLSPQLSPRRWFWEQTRGPVPRGTHVWARCKKSRCVNPACVVLGSKPVLQEAC